VAPIIKAVPIAQTETATKCKNFGDQVYLLRYLSIREFPLNHPIKVNHATPQKIAPITSRYIILTKSIIEVFYVNFD